MTTIPSHYVVTCPDCRGRMFIVDVLCPTCNGDGRLLIPERTPRYRSTSIRALRVLFLLALFVGAIVALAVNR